MNLAVIAINNSALMVTFDPPMHSNGVLTGYNISYVSVSDVDAGNAQSLELEPTETIRIIDNLDTLTQYRVTVIAFTRIGPGEEAVGFGITDPLASSPPTNFVAVTVASEYVTLTWGYPKHPHGIIQGYIVEYYQTNTPDSSLEENITLSLDNDNSTQIFNVSGLLPSFSYTFLVRAYSFGNDFAILVLGMESSPLTITTNQSSNVVLY